MLLRESLGNVNCRTTMIAHISAAAGSYAETLSTIQIASRVLRMKKKKTKVRAVNRRENTLGTRTESQKANPPRRSLNAKGQSEHSGCSPCLRTREPANSTGEVECPFHRGCGHGSSTRTADRDYFRRLPLYDEK